MDDLKIVVLISGRGSNLKAIANMCSGKNIPAKIIAVISNNPNASGLKLNGDYKRIIINEKKRLNFEFLKSVFSKSSTQL